MANRISIQAEFDKFINLIDALEGARKANDNLAVPQLAEGGKISAPDADLIFNSQFDREESDKKVDELNQSTKEQHEILLGLLQQIPNHSVHVTHPISGEAYLLYKEAETVGFQLQ